jgi:rare lipoprotein A
LLLLLTGPLGCAHAPGASGTARPDVPESSARAEPGQSAASRSEVGVASFYAYRHQGRRTASGERYDADAMTCAHPRLPFGTWVRVTDLETGQEVKVRVNDRGPFTRRKRVIDLSYEAARRLGMVQRGLARVRVEPLE